MSLAPLSVPERKQSPNLNINLGSNNPFRNRAVSPTSPLSPNSNNRLERPRSTNPFLDETETLSPQSAPGGMGSLMGEDHALTGNAAELFENLSLDPAKPKDSKPPPSRPEKPYRPSKERSEGREKDPFDIFADPPKKDRSQSKHRERRPRPRRNSDSSVMEKQKPLDPEEEKRRRERRHRDKDSRHRDGKHRSQKPSRRLDVIDKLDVTSIYGTGLFHHDGPFDACNPHRNRKGSRVAPMQAFPKDSKNMALGGAGPLNQNIDLALFHGQTSEGYLDYSASGERKGETMAFDSATRVEPIHGAETMGLGTSTFLEGTPASRAAIQRRQSDDVADNGGLQRKKSLAQKIRGINRTTSTRVISPEPAGISPGSAGPSSSSIKNNEKNPFFQDYDDAYEKKGAKIQLAEESRASGVSGRSRSSSNPKQSLGLERRTTNDRPSGSAGGEENKPNGGFMNRMKSMRKTRPERRTTSD